MSRPEPTRTAVLRLLAEALPAGASIEPGVPLAAHGLDSLATARLALSLYAEFGVDIPMDRLAAGAGIEHLVDLVERDGTGPRHIEVAPPGEPGDPFPLTPVQESYLVAKHASVPGDAYGSHQYREFTVDGLDPERLRAAWATVVARHDALRLVGTADGRQRVLPEAPEWSMPIHDLRDADPDTLQRHLDDERHRLSHERFEPGEWPPYAVSVTRTPDGGGVVRFSLDAGVTDGAGGALLLDDWWRCYEQRPLPEVGPSPRDCLLRLAATTPAEERAADLAYWADRLTDLPPAPGLIREVPGDAGPVRRRPRTARVGPAQWRAVQDRAVAWQVSPTALVLTLFLHAWRRVGASERFPVVLTTNTRLRLPDAAAATVGPFTSTLVFVPGAEVGQGIEDAARAVHRDLWRDLDHGSLCGVTVLRELRVRDTARPIVFTSMLDARQRGGSEGFAAADGFAVDQTSGVALEHQMWERAGELWVRWDVADDRFPTGVPDLLFAAFVGAVQAVAAYDPGAVDVRPMNELQQAYFVARSLSVDGCQIALTCVVPELTVDRLAAAWLRLVAAYEPLRTTADPAGRLLVSPHAPAEWPVPVVDLSGVPDPDAVLDDLRRLSFDHAFPLGRGRHVDLWVTTSPDGTARVHFVADLLVLDGRSIHLVFRELLRRYAGAEPRRVLDLPRPVIDHARAAAHWRERVVALPPGPALGPVGGRRERVRLSGSLAGWARVKQRAAERGLSPDAVLLAVFTDVLAARYPEPFAVPVVRWTDATEPARPGEFTALSWIRHRPGLSLLDRATRYERELAEDRAVDPVSGLTELRGRTMRERRNGAFAHEVVYSGVYDLTGHPLPPGFVDGPWLTCTPDVRLDCIAVDTGDELSYAWDLEADLADTGGAELFDRYRAALEGLAGDWDERPGIPHGWNDTARPFAADGPVHLLFERRARDCPQGTALRWRGGAMTYGELNRWANRLAWRLTRQGVGPERVVAISLRRGPAMVAAVYGVLKAGGAYLPVDPALPRERAELILAEAGATELIADVTALPWPVPSGVRLVAMPPDAGEPDAPGDDGNPPVTATADSTAYLIFTSGSTGRPKGVAVTHRPVHNLLAWCSRTFGFGPSDTGLCVTSLGFDLSVFDLLGLLGCGAAVYVADEAQQRDPYLLLRILLDEPVTFWNSAPTTLSQLAPLLPEHTGHPGADRLRLVFLSGDFTPLTLPDDLRAVFRHARIVSLGGATEATVWSNYFVVDQVDPAWRSIPYGRPIDNARYYILDDDRQPCPVGVPGELYIAGPCLSAGYHGQPELTAQRFLPDEFHPESGERMYRTGDRAVRAADGVLTLLGRVDDQVKVRGYRVELGEIEHRLRQHPGVKDAVVLARDDSTGDRRLVAYVLPAGPTPPPVADVRAHAAAGLPDYMVPNVVAYLTAFPATANGKLDRAALPWPIAPAAPAEPATPAALEDDIGALFAELLGVSRVDPGADLWDQGATSFTMVQVSGALRQRYGQRIEVATLLEEPSVAAIARHVAAGLAGGVEPEAVAPAGPGAVDFFSAADRDRFKAGHWNERTPTPDRPVLPLPDVDYPTEYYRWRASYRRYDPGPVPAASLAGLLGLVRRIEVDGALRSLYPSAGDTFAVQVYVHVRPGRVTGLPEGIYYYRPREHTLEQLDDRSRIDRSVHFSYNRPLFDSAAFEVYLIGQTRGIEPLYGPDAERYLALEAGYLGQVLMSGQATRGIGLCPIGGLAVAPIREALRLDEGHVFLQGFVGGGVTHAVRPAVARTVAGPVAVVGVAGRYPGASSLDSLWRTLRAGRTAIGPLPTARADFPAIPGGYLDDIETFDSLPFRISPAEARTLDPHLRVLLPVVSECLAHAGHTADSLHRVADRVGVFVAVMWHDHRQAGADDWRHTGAAHIAALGADLPNRVSHAFDLRGPSVAVDTSCSSALSALHLATRSLDAGDCTAAIVAAVNLFAHPYHLALLSGLDLLAAGGSAGAFDGAAPGWTPGEGVGALLLRPGPDAVRDRDVAHGLVEAVGTGHSGRAARFGAPRTDALADSIRATLRRSGLRPDDIDYVECAAAGASLADAAELDALGQVFGDRATPLPIGTVKPTLGHAEAAAGLAQVTKVLLQLRYDELAPTRLAPTPNPLVAWDTLPIRAVTEREPWPRRSEGPRRALVNAIGANGSSGHVVLRAADR